MKIPIDLVINNLSGILTEATEHENSVCYVTEDDAETLQVAIETMRKYQKIEQILDDCKECDLVNDFALDEIKEVIED